MEWVRKGTPVVSISSNLNNLSLGYKRYFFFKSLLSWRVKFCFLYISQLDEGEKKPLLGKKIVSFTLEETRIFVKMRRTVIFKACNQSVSLKKKSDSTLCSDFHRSKYCFKLLVYWWWSILVGEYRFAH